MSDSSTSFDCETFIKFGGFDADIGDQNGNANLQDDETEHCACLAEEYDTGVCCEPRTRLRRSFAIGPTCWLLHRALW